MDEKAVEDKYRPFWQSDKDSQSSPDSPIGNIGAPETLGNTSGVEKSGQDKSFFEDMPTYIEGTKSDLPNVSRKKKKVKNFKSEIKVETYNATPRFSLTKIIPTIITLMVFCVVGSVVWTTVVNDPAMQQQFNSTGLNSLTDSAFKVLPVIVILGIGIIVIFGVFGLGGHRGD
jgi:hypothetical protein